MWMLALALALQANVLVTEGLRLKICDFGISRSVDGAHSDMTGNIGTIAWSAPEMYLTMTLSAFASSYF